MPMRIFPLKPIQPIHTKPRTLVTRPRVPQRYIRLLAQIVQRTIVAVIVHEKEMINALLAVVFEEIGKADLLVPLGAEQ